jgi:O-antigen ligase
MNIEKYNNLFLIFFTVFTILILSVFRHGTTVCYFVLWLYLCWLHGRPAELCRTSLTFSLRSPFVFLTALMIAGICSTLWSILPSQTLLQSCLNFLTVGSMAVFFSSLLSQEFLRSEKFFKYLSILFFTSLLILLAQAFTGSPLRVFMKLSYRSLKPNAEVLALLAFPVLAFFLQRKQYRLSILVFAGTLFLTYCVEIRTSFLALIIASGAGVLFYIIPRVMIFLLAVSSFIYTMVLPWVFSALSHIDFCTEKFNCTYDSFIHRLHVWRFISARILKNPWLGCGASVSHNFPGGKVTVLGTNWEVLPSHPHHYVMQVWLEQGALGALLLACFQSVLIWKMRQVPSRLLTALLGFYLVAVMIMLSMSHSLWHKWWITWIALCGGLVWVSAPLAGEGAKREEDI